MNMFLERAKILQKQFPALDLTLAQGWIEDAYKHETERSYSGVITSYIFDSAAAYVLGRKDQLACYAAGIRLAQEYMNTKLYKALNDG
jgi:hypothetical protein